MFAIAPELVRADINGFGDFSNFTVNVATPFDSDPVPTIPALGAIELTHFGSLEDRSIYFNTPQNISKFTASFTYQALGGHDGGLLGATFVLQNSGIHAIGDIFGYGEQGGDGGIANSAAITLKLGGNGGTGLYTGGNVGGGSASTSPVVLLSGDPANLPWTGDPINVSLVYNGTTLRETLVDANTSDTFTTLYLINLPSAIGSSTAFVGFTAGGEPDFDRLQDKQIVSNFQFHVPEPSSAAMLVGAGCVGLLAAIRRRRVLLCAFRWVAGNRSVSCALLCCPVLVVIGSAANAGFVFTHSGDADPLSEEFSRDFVFGAPSAIGPIADDQGLPAWSVLGTGQDSQYSYASGALSTSQLIDITNHGFTFTMIARAVQGINPTYDASHPVAVAGGGLNTGLQRFDVALGLDGNGNSVVFLVTADDNSGPGSSLVGTGPSYTLTGNDYHTYTLTYDPLTQLADLFIDGVQRIEGYAGNSTNRSNVGLYFGAASGGQGDFNFVEVTSVPEPSTLALALGGGAIGLLAYIRRRFRPVMII
jgi:hypothetical protein